MQYEVRTYLGSLYFSLFMLLHFLSVGFYFQFPKLMKHAKLHKVCRFYLSFVMLVPLFSSSPSYVYIKWYESKSTIFLMKLFNIGYVRLCSWAVKFDWDSSSHSSILIWFPFGLSALFGFFNYYFFPPHVSTSLIFVFVPFWFCIPMAVLYIFIYFG